MHEKFLARAAKAAREEAVLDAYQLLLRKAEWPRPFGSDGLVDGVLYEFKKDWSMTTQYAKGLAQAAYYLRQVLKVGVDQGKHWSPPKRIAVCDKNEAFIVHVVLLEPYALDDKYDWDRAASSPDPKLVQAIHANVPSGKIFRMDSEEGVDGFLAKLQEDPGEPVFQQITVRNFVAIYQLWKAAFATELSDQQATLAYMLDLQKLGVFRHGKLRLQGDPDGAGKVVTVELAVQEHIYLEFWSTYKRPPTTEEFEKIIERKDQCIAIAKRRNTGEFFTPADLCSKAHEYLVRAGVKYEDVYWWDCCAGSGNLVVDCPSMPGRLFVSTLEKEDLEHMKLVGLHPEADFFQMDFLNDEVPAKVKKRLEERDGKWVVLINPPFGAGTDLHGSLGKTGETKTGMSSTKTRERMEKDGLHGACQNLFSQFMYRLSEIMPSGTVLGMFSKAVFMGGSNYETFAKVWSEKWESAGGMSFQAGEFNGATGNWPVVFSVWRKK